MHAHADVRAVTAGTATSVDTADAEGATLKSWEYMTSSKSLMRGVEARQALVDWVALLAQAHPVSK